MEILIASLLIILIAVEGLNVYMKYKKIDKPIEKPNDKIERQLEMWKAAINHSVEDDLKAIKRRRTS